MTMLVGRQQKQVSHGGEKRKNNKNERKKMKMQYKFFCLCMYPLFLLII